MQWGLYRQEAQRLATIAEQRLLSLQTTKAEGNVDIEPVRREAEETLQALRTLNDTVDTTALTQSNCMQVERFRQVVYEGTAELARAARALRAQRGRDSLLGDVHNTLHTYAGNSALETEAGHIDKTQREVEILQQMAGDSHIALQRSQNVLTRASDRAREIATRVPALHNLLNQIGRRHNKEGLILGAVIGVCVFLLWVFS